MVRRGPTLQISDPAPLTSGMKLKRHRRVRWIWLVGRIEHKNGPIHSWRFASRNFASAPSGNTSTNFRTTLFLPTQTSVLTSADFNSNLNLTHSYDFSPTVTV